MRGVWGGGCGSEVGIGPGRPERCEARVERRRGRRARRRRGLRRPVQARGDVGNKAGNLIVLRRSRLHVGCRLLRRSGVGIDGGDDLRRHGGGLGGDGLVNLLDALVGPDEGNGKSLLFLLLLLRRRIVRGRRGVNRRLCGRTVEAKRRGGGNRRLGRLRRCGLGRFVLRGRTQITRQEAVTLHPRLAALAPARLVRAGVFRHGGREHVRASLVLRARKGRDAVGREKERHDGDGERNVRHWDRRCRVDDGVVPPRSSLLRRRSLLMPALECSAARMLGVVVKSRQRVTHTVSSLEHAMPQRAPQRTLIIIFLLKFQKHSPYFGWGRRTVRFAPRDRKSARALSLARRRGSLFTLPPPPLVLSLSAACTSKTGKSGVVGGRKEAWHADTHEDRCGGFVRRACVRDKRAQTFHEHFMNL